jgi:hypothetical protein
MKSVLLTSLLCALSVMPLTYCGCKSQSTTTTPVTPQVAAAEAQSKPTPAPSDPTCCGLASNNSEGVARAWQLFTRDGRYRLARPEDMLYPDAAREKLGHDWHAYTRPFVYSWGRRNFDTEKDHLAAIVVDTTADGSDRFGLVMFSAPAGGRGYEPHWLYKGRDLSRTILSAPSGYLFVSELADDGTFLNGCEVSWVKPRRQYVCKPMKS